jgi:AcrR family transcriptional regulator
VPASPTRVEYTTALVAILDAADELFYQRGIQAVGMDELRDRAGVTLKRIYAEFPSKANLVEAYLTRRDEKWRDGIEAYVTRRSEDPREQLLLVFDALQAWTRHEPGFRGCTFHNAVGELGGTAPAVISLARSNKHHLRAFLERTARRARLRRPAEVAFQLMLLAEGSLITAAIDQDPGVPGRAKGAARVILDAAS